MNNNKYFMYGISVPYDKYREWENETGRRIPNGIYGDIFCFFSGRDGAKVIIGKKIRASNHNSPIVVPELTKFEEHEIRLSVLDKFGFEGEFHYYFIIE
jgi:hypothetical protein